MYKIIRPLLFLLDPEKIHTLIFEVLRVIIRIPGGQSLLKLLFRYENPALPRSLLGLTFMNPVGLAAGFDKDAKLIDALSCFGFGFIEIGTVTPKGQPGNPKPRLFRLPADHALSNRMGFNNEGARAAAERLKKWRGSVIIGGNIGKNKSTPNEFAHEDYIFCFNALYEHVDYFVVNVSSPNTPGLRELQEKEPLTHLLTSIKELSNSKPLPRPVLLKIAPDLTPGQLNDIVAILKATGVEGVIATNTTVSRDHLTTEAAELERVGAGGISGRPLASRSTEIIRHLRTAMGKDFPIIGVGGIMSPADALDKLEAGADLIQIYTGFIYEGPGFVKRLNEAIAKRLTFAESAGSL